MRHSAIATYRAAFGKPAAAAASAPSAVSLVGMHTAPYGGPVLSVATAERSVAVVGHGVAGRLELLVPGTAGGETVASIFWKDTLPAGVAGVAVGVLRELWALDAVPRGGGVRVVIAGPNGPGPRGDTGVAVARAMAKLAGAKLTARQLAGVAFRAARHHGEEARHAADYMVAALARPHHALLLDTAALAARHVPLRARLLVVETGVQHDAAGVTAAARRAECRDATARLRVALPELIWLASWPPRWLARLKKALPEPQRARAVHVVSETARVRYAAALLSRRRLAHVGALMYETHESCRRYFDCSAAELDLVVQAARRGGALGAVLSGVGWGGPVVVLVGGERERGVAAREARVIASVTGAFRRTYGRGPEIRPLRAGGGVRLQPV